MKASLVAIAVAVLLVVSSAVALAAPPTPQEKADKANKGGPKAGIASVEKGKRHGVAGVVQSADSGFNVVTKHGTVHVVVNDATKFSIKGDDTPSLEDLKDGYKVNVQGTWEGDDLVAKRVHVIPARPKFSHAVGLVTAFTAAGDTDGSITVKDRRTGESRVFVVTSTTKIEYPDGKTSIEVNDRVTVVGTKDTPTVAKVIAVHGPKGED